MNNSRTGFADEYPFESHYLTIGECQYHYLDEGTGEPLLMVHGNPTWSFAWRNLIKNLSQDYRVLAVDHIGCGFSDKPVEYPYTLEQHIRNLTEFITQLDLNPITLFAHDWGGAIGMGTAGRSPERFNKFVLMNTAAFRSRRIPLRIAVCRIPVLGRYAMQRLNLFAKAALQMAVENQNKMTPAVKAGYLAPYDNWDHRIAIARFVEDIPLKPAHPSYKTLVQVEHDLLQFRNHPMLLLWGMKDWCFTPAFLEEFQERFPQAISHPIPDAGHYVFEDAWQEILAQSRIFLNQHPVMERDGY